MARILMTADQVKQLQTNSPKTGSGRILMTADQAKQKIQPANSVKKVTPPKPNIFKRVDEAINKPAYSVADDGNKGGFLKNLVPTVGKSLVNTAKDLGANVYGALKFPFSVGKSLVYDLPKKAIDTAKTQGATGLFNLIPKVVPKLAQNVLPPALQAAVPDYLGGEKPGRGLQIKKGIESVAEKPVTNILPYVLGFKGLTEGVTGTKSVGLFKKSYLPDIAEGFKEQGIKPPASAISKSAAVKIGESGASKGMFGQKVYDQIYDARNALDEKTIEVINKIKPENLASAEDAGKTIQQGVKEYEQKFKDTQEKVYEKFNMKYGKAPAQTASTGAIGVRILEQQSKDLYKGVDPKISSMVEKVIDEGSKDSFDFGTLRATRTAIGEALARDPENGALKQLYGSLSDDMDATVRAVDKTAGETLDKIDGDYKSGIQKIKSNIVQSIDQSNPERIVQNLVKRNSADTQRLIKSMIGEERYKQISETFIRQLFEKSNTSVNKVSKFDFSKFKKNLAQYDQATINEILGKDKVAEMDKSIKQLEKIDKLNRSMKSADKIREGSQTAYIGIQAAKTTGIGGVIVGALAAGNFKLAANALIFGTAEIVGEYGFSKLFSTETGKNFLTKGVDVNYPRIFPVENQQNKTPRSTPTSILPFKKKK